MNVAEPLMSLPFRSKCGSHEMKLESVALAWFLKLIELSGSGAQPKAEVYRCDVTCDCEVSIEGDWLVLLYIILLIQSVAITLLVCLPSRSGAARHGPASSPRRKRGGSVQMPSRPACGCVLQ